MASKRAPKCPSISLVEAIQRVKKIYNAEGHGVFDDETAVKHMGYNGLSGASRQTLGACRSFGLIEGRGVDLNLSGDAITIIADEDLPDQGDRIIALQNVMTHNPVFKELVGRYGRGGSNIGITSFLQKSNSFKPEAAKKVASNYIASAEFALSDSQENDTIDHEVDNDSLAVEVKVGDSIQWTSQDVDMFVEPKVITSIDDTGEWLFVDGEKTGIPMSEVTIVESGSQNVDAPKTPPQNPNFKKVGFEPYAPSIEEKVFMASALSKSEENPVSFKLLVTGDMGVNEIGKLIKLLEAQKMILED